MWNLNWKTKALWLFYCAGSYLAIGSIGFTVMATIGLWLLVYER